jgi:hypothetical protein
MPVIDRHRYTVGLKFGYPTQKRPSEPPYCPKIEVDFGTNKSERYFVMPTRQVDDQKFFG